MIFIQFENFGIKNVLFKENKFSMNMALAKIYAKQFHYINFPFYVNTVSKHNWTIPFLN